MSLGHSPGWRRFFIVSLRPLLLALFRRDRREQARIPSQNGVIMAAIRERRRRDGETRPM